MLWWLFSIAPLCLGSFVEEGWVGEGRGRELLQLDEGEEGQEAGEGSEAPPKLTTTTTEEPFSKENQAGPEEFYFENGKLPKLLMTVEKGITIEIFEAGKSVDRIVLSEAATGGISGSKLSPDEDELEVRIDYKGQRFVGENGKEISGLLVTMLFEGRASNWALTKLEIENLGIEGSFISDDLSVVSSHGYRISAPKGLAWCCQQAGLFSPSMNETTGEKFAVGLRLPSLRLQVFEVVRGQFGPEWECGELLSIGLITGILVTLGFALICFWGFSMLANINTMDRFDDPKGSGIHVPITD
jgi:hypothetical protein